MLFTHASPTVCLLKSLLIPFTLISQDVFCICAVNRVRPNNHRNRNLYTLKTAKKKTRYTTCAYSCLKIV